MAQLLNTSPPPKKKCNKFVKLEKFIWLAVGETRSRDCKSLFFYDNSCILYYFNTHLLRRFTYTRVKYLHVQIIPRAKFMRRWCLDVWIFTVIPE